MKLELSEATISSVRRGPVANIEVSFSDTETGKLLKFKLSFEIDIRNEQTIQAVWDKAASEAHQFISQIYESRGEIKRKVSGPASG